MVTTPTREQRTAAQALSEALLNFVLSLRPEEPKPLPNLPGPATTVSSAPVGPRDAVAEPILLGTREAAQRLSMCEKTLWSLTVPRGPIPAIRIGRAVRYAIEDLQAWVKRARDAEGRGTPRKE